MIGDTGPKFSFQVKEACVFKVARPGINAADTLRVNGAGTLVLKPKHAAEGHPTETFEMREEQDVFGQFLEIVSADEGCFPIFVEGY